MTVEIITSAPGPRPNALWLNYVITVKARSSIRNYLKHFKQQEAVSLGRRYWKKNCKPCHLQFWKISRKPGIQALLKVNG